MDNKPKTVTFSHLLTRKDEDGTFSILKEEHFQEYYNPVEVSVVSSGFKDELQAQMMIAWMNTKKVKPEDFILRYDDSLRFIELDDLAFKYCMDTLGSGWNLASGYKLITSWMIGMWVVGMIECNQFGVDPFAHTGAEVIEALAGAINKVMDIYAPTSK